MRLIEDFIDRVKRRQQDLQEALGAGNARDYAHYQNLVGEVAGLELALDYLDQLISEDETLRSRM